MESVHISLADLHNRAQKFEKRIHRRNLREYLAAAIVIVCFGYYIWKFPNPMIRSGCVLVIAGVLFVVYMLHKRGHTRVVPREMAFHSSLDFYRKELERQRDLLRSVWTWYLLPFVPGFIIFQLGLFLRAAGQPNAPVHALAIGMRFGFSVIAFALMFIAVGMLNRRAARKLQGKIDALDSLEKEP